MIVIVQRFCQRDQFADDEVKVVTQTDPSPEVQRPALAIKTIVRFIRRTY